MARTRTDVEGSLARIAAGDGWKLLRHLLGGAVILALWLALWAGVAVGVVRPLSALARGSAPAALATPD